MNSVTESAESIVGFDALPDQLVHRSCKSGFSFNILCVGEPSIGKTTLINSLFALPKEQHHKVQQVEKDGSVPAANCPVQLYEQRHELVEAGIKLRLNVIETKNYGNQIDKTSCYQPIATYIDAQFQKALDLELHLDSYPGQTLTPISLDKDPCIHACLYFIVPTGHSIKAIDLITIRELADRVNLIPIIAKADALTSNELLKMKKQVQIELKDVKLYAWPTDDEAVSKLNKCMNERMPFAVVGSTESVRIGNNDERARGRTYKWGTVHVSH